MLDRTVKAAVLIGLSLFWGVGGWWWYRCGIKGFCARDATARLTDKAPARTPFVASPGAEAAPSPHAADPVAEAVMSRLPPAERPTPSSGPPASSATEAPEITVDGSVAVEQIPDRDIGRKGAPLRRPPGLNPSDVNKDSEPISETEPSKEASPARPENASRRLASPAPDRPGKASSSNSPPMTTATAKIPEDPEKNRQEPAPSPPVVARVESRITPSEPQTPAVEEAVSFPPYVRGDRSFAVVAREAVPPGGVPRHAYLYFEQTVSGVVPADVDAYLNDVARLASLGGKRIRLVVPAVDSWDFGPIAFANERRARYVRILLHRRGVPLSAMEIRQRGGGAGLAESARPGFPTVPVELVVQD